MKDIWVHDEAYGSNIAGWNFLAINDKCFVSQKSYVVLASLGLMRGSHLEPDTPYRLQKSRRACRSALKETFWLYMCEARRRLLCYHTIRRERRQSSACRGGGGGWCPGVVQQSLEV